jgi:hypothetical protein
VIIQDLLFILAMWHGLAKLRLQTETTLRFLEKTTKALGKTLRRFVWHVCSQVNTHKTSKEAQARVRCKKKAQSKGKAKKQGGKGGNSNTTGSESGTHKKTFNMLTFKMHSLEHYPATIRLFGTTDSYTTQPVCCETHCKICTDRFVLQGELEHRRGKSWFC